MSDLILSYPQHIFLNVLNTKFRAFVGGFGSGKTAVGCIDLLLFASKYPQKTQGYFGVTYSAIRDVFYPTLEEMAFNLGFTVKVKLTDKEVDLYRGGAYYGTIICRSMDKPSSIIGFKIARALVDEIDTLSKEKANDAWNKIVARLRLLIDGVVNGVGVTTTPEGWRFVYERFVLNRTESYSLVQASTYENEANLPPDYIPSLIETYPQELLNAYIKGEFCNLKSGTVYYAYNRERHASNEYVKPNDKLIIGMDFNVGKMHASIFVLRGNEMHLVDEFSGILDTPAMINAIKNRYANTNIEICPDASGKNRDTGNALQTDFTLLKAAGFKLNVAASNPSVNDRVLSVNAAFEKGFIKVNMRKAKESASCLEQQAYDKNGDPDKTTGKDHANDATTYAIYRYHAIKRPSHSINIKYGGYK